MQFLSPRWWGCLQLGVVLADFLLCWAVDSLKSAGISVALILAALGFQKIAFDILFNED